MAAPDLLSMFDPPGWVPPPWMRCTVRCRLVLEHSAGAEPFVLELVGDRVRRCRIARPDPADDLGGPPVEQVLIEVPEAFVAAWLTDPDALLGDALGAQLRLEGQLFLVSLFDGLVGQHKAEALVAR